MKLKEYLVKWKGWNSKFNSWEHEDSCSCPDAIGVFNGMDDDNEGILCQDRCRKI